MNNIEKFKDEREQLNEKVLKFNGKIIKRFYNLDHNVYVDGVLSKKTKELLGLISSFVLRCDDCVNYHLAQCHEAGVTDDELDEALSVGVVVGGSITIPHLRRVIKTWLELKENEE
ncbi:MAG TPA: carboxymuconolactone decarboxylase family protein [Candidatus Cloacimonetes bacterium]|nr:carboxymuconolactone decarboxylase family protein [Candidatus Cloacimonadota bacterium]